MYLAFTSSNFDHHQCLHLPNMKRLYVQFQGLLYTWPCNKNFFFFTEGLRVFWSILGQLFALISKIIISFENKLSKYDLFTFFCFFEIFYDFLSFYVYIKSYNHLNETNIFVKYLF